MYWDLTRSTGISQDILRSHKIYWFGKIHLTFYIWTFTFYIWYLTLTCHDMPFDIYWDLTRSTEISKDLLRSQKIYWFGIIHLTFGIWHFVFDILHLTFCIWHLTCHDIEIWHDIWNLKFFNLTFEIWNLTFDIWHWYDILHDWRYWQH